MGETESLQAGFAPVVVGDITAGATTARDSRRAAADLRAEKVDLILFAGGDGTARDIYNAIGMETPVIGIPAGVKIHSGVYATRPGRAGDLAALYLRDRVKHCGQKEVMDIDEDAYRRGRVSAKLYGYLSVPIERRYTQSVKSASAGDEHEIWVQESIAEQVVRHLSNECIYLIGAGTTPRAIMNRLGLANSLLGIDAVFERRLIGRDLNERQILDLVDGHRVKMVITPIGGQGYLFGRGNQQLSPAVIDAVGADNVIVVATPNKLNALQRRPLLVDTGSAELDQRLRGYIRVVTGFGEEKMCKVA
jgi:predicted polyphosphate/ATP-dependent NAD kinase